MIQQTATVKGLLQYFGTRTRLSPAAYPRLIPEQSFPVVAAVGLSWSAENGVAMGIKRKIRQTRISAHRNPVAQGVPHTLYIGDIISSLSKLPSNRFIMPSPIPPNLSWF
jgi:hypothetical protein